MSSLAETAPPDMIPGLRDKPLHVSMSLDTVDPSLEIGWDDLVLSHPECTFFHGAAWVKVLKDAYGFTPHYLALCAAELSERACPQPQRVEPSWVLRLGKAALRFMGKERLQNPDANRGHEPAHIVRSPGFSRPGSRPTQTPGIEERHTG